MIRPLAALGLALTSAALVASLATAPALAQVKTSAPVASKGYIDNGLAAGIAATALEKARAQAAEAANATAISTNAAGIANEITRAQAAESLLLPKAGGTVSGEVKFGSSVGGSIASRPGGGAFLTVFAPRDPDGTNRSAAAIDFFRDNAYGVWFGLDTDNEFRRGGFSDGLASYRFWTEKNFDPGTKLNLAGGTMTGAIVLSPGSSGPIDGMSSTASGGVARTQADRLTDGINIKDYGAKGDNTANDTPAWLTARNVAVAMGRPVRFPQGTYLIDFMDMRDRSTIVPMYGEGDVVIKKRINDGNPLLQINADGQANSGMVYPRTVSNLRFDANGNASYAMLTYNLARWHFPNTKFINATADGALFLGGIQNTLDGVDAYSNGRAGLAFDKYTYGFPNLNTVSNSGLFDNGIAGVYFDGGRALQLLNNDYEHNGTAGLDASGAVVAGTAIGVEDASGIKPGITLIGGWIEGNKGSGGAIVLGSGHNRIVGTHTVANATSYDVKANGGTYDISHTVFDGVRSHVKDTAGTGYGNALTENRYGGTNEIDPAKTALYGAESAWTAYTPVLSADTGALGSTAYAVGAYQRVGNTMSIRVSVGIGTAGTAAGDLRISLPVAAKGDGSVAGQVGSVATTGSISNGQAYVRQRRYDGASLIANNAGLVATFSYEVPN